MLTTTLSDLESSNLIQKKNVMVMVIIQHLWQLPWLIPKMN